MGALGRIALHLSLPLVSQHAAGAVGCMALHLSLPLVSQHAAGAVGCMALHLSLPLVSQHAVGAVGCMALHLSLPLVSQHAAGAVGCMALHLSLPLVSQHAVGAVGCMALHLSLPLVSQHAAGAVGRMALHFSPICLPVVSRSRPTDAEAKFWSCIPFVPTCPARGFTETGVSNIYLGSVVVSLFSMDLFEHLMLKQPDCPLLDSVQRMAHVELSAGDCINLHPLHLEGLGRERWEVKRSSPEQPWSWVSHNFT